MVILALETVTRGGSIALFDDGVIHGTTGGDPSQTHGTRMPGEALSFLSLHGRTLRDLTFLCVVTGPGSFTGIRIGLAATQGLALTTGLQVIPVPSLEALAAAWREEHRDTSTRLVACLDGARGDVFVAVFESAPGDPEEDLRVLVAPFVAKPGAAADALQVFSDGDLTMIGDGVEKYEPIWRSRLPRADLKTATFNMAIGAVRVASRMPQRAVAPHALKPVYVRRPDAEIARSRVSMPAEPAVRVTRSTSPDDLRDVATLQRRSFTNAWGAEAIQWELDNTDVARLYVARTEAGDLVAYCACWIVFDELHINSLAVDDRYRRQRIARRLLDHVLRDAVGDGARMATLEVRQSNDAARGLYAGLGFKIEGVRRNYYQDPREDGLILWNRSLGLVLAGGAS